MNNLNTPYITKQTGDTPLPMVGDFRPTIPSRFATWERRILGVPAP